MGQKRSSAESKESDPHSRPGMVRLHSDRGQKIMRSAAFQGGYPMDRKQKTKTSCGVCSAAIVVSCIRGMNISEKTVLQDASSSAKELRTRTKKCARSRCPTCRNLRDLTMCLENWRRSGCSLYHLNALLRHGLSLKTRFHFTSDSKIQTFERALRRFEAKQSHILVNVRIKRGGHWGVVAAVSRVEGDDGLPETQILVLEVNNPRLHYWVSATTLYQFMDTITSARVTRGWIEVLVQSSVPAVQLDADPVNEDTAPATPAEKEAACRTS